MNYIYLYIYIYTNRKVDGKRDNLRKVRKGEREKILVIGRDTDRLWYEEKKVIEERNMYRQFERRL